MPLATAQERGVCRYCAGRLTPLSTIKAPTGSVDIVLSPTVVVVKRGREFCCLPCARTRGIYQGRRTIQARPG